jgi:HPt (histidine-containing phosphotransfer) domain-containing protein
MTVEREAPTGAGSAQWPPAAAVARLHDLFADLIPDLAERAEDYRTDADLVDRETWSLFAEELQRALVVLEAGCAALDPAVVRGRGHSLEGMGGTIGLPDLSVVGAALSQAAREQEWEQCAVLVRRLRAWAAVATGALGDP